MHDIKYRVYLKVFDVVTENNNNFQDKIAIILDVTILKYNIIYN